MIQDSRCYRAQLVFDLHGKPIANGTVEFVNGQCTVHESGAGEDLGQVALIPALVNAHTHLEFSDLVQPLGEPGTRFSEWIIQVVAARISQSQGGLAKPDAIQRGLHELAGCGTALAGEIATLPLDLAWYQHDTVTARAFVERLSLDPTRSRHLVDEATQVVAAAEVIPHPVGLSPHAPYSVHPQLLEELCRQSALRQLPLAMHLAESWEEMELLQSGCGGLVEMMTKFNAWNPTAIPRGIEVMDYLERLATAHRSLVVHGNYLGTDELDFLAENRQRMTLVFCPRTHHFFGHGEHPFADLLQRGGSVALGTDSRASNPDLNVFEEARFVVSHFPAVPPLRVLQMVTTEASRALGYGEHPAAMTIVRLPDNAPADPYEALFSGTAAGLLT